MHSFNEYSRTLLIEFLQKTILLNLGKFKQKQIYWYFPLTNKNKLFILFDCERWLLFSFIKYEDRDKKDLLIANIKVINNNSIENFTNITDKFLDDKKFKKWSSKILNFWKLDFSFKD